MVVDRLRVTVPFWVSGIPRFSWAGGCWLGSLKQPPFLQTRICHGLVLPEMMYNAAEDRSLWGEGCFALKHVKGH